MEKFPRFKERGIAEQESIEQIKKPFIALCEQMKSQIESNQWDAIVSDEAGGRIPTLLLLEIFKLVRGEMPKNLFVSAGYYGPKDDSDEQKFNEYIQKGLHGSKKILVVTQYVREGGSLSSLIHRIKEADPEIQTTDVATVNVLRDDNIGFAGIATDPKKFPEMQKKFAESGAERRGFDHFYIGEIVSTPRNEKGEHEYGINYQRQPSLEHDHEILSGITKNPVYDPRPMRLDKAIKNGAERQRFLSVAERYGINPDKKYPPPKDIWEEVEQRSQRQKDHDAELQKMEQLNSIPLSDEENKSIQNNINLTRAHIKKLAKEIYDEVWTKPRHETTTAE